MEIKLMETTILRAMTFWGYDENLSLFILSFKDGGGTVDQNIIWLFQRNTLFTLALILVICWYFLWFEDWCDFFRKFFWNISQAIFWTFSELFVLRFFFENVFDNFLKENFMSFFRIFFPRNFFRKIFPKFLKEKFWDFFPLIFFIFFVINIME